MPAGIRSTAVLRLFFRHCAHDFWVPFFLLVECFSSRQRTTRRQPDKGRSIFIKVVAPFCFRQPCRRVQRPGLNEMSNKVANLIAVELGVLIALLAWLAFANHRARAATSNRATAHPHGRLLRHRRSPPPIPVAGTGRLPRRSRPGTAAGPGATAGRAGIRADHRARAPTPTPISTPVTSPDLTLLCRGRTGTALRVSGLPVRTGRSLRRLPAVDGFRCRFQFSNFYAPSALTGLPE